MDGSIQHSFPARDFQRNVYTILGLPLDALSMDEVIARMYTAIDTPQPCFISTPNLNFLISSQKDWKLRRSIINSDLCLADGMPLILIARLLGIPLKERLAGSSLIETLMCAEQGYAPPINVFFFGGANGVADRACDKLAEISGGIHCVGSINPGFGSVEEMSEPGIIERINRSGADFVIVSLGARKGQEWIERNRHRLDAPIISHLGAVVNFVAGTIDRAPLSWQRCGLEWLWRIKEEPFLWKRYSTDALGLTGLLLTRVFPYAFLIRRKRGVISLAHPFSMAVRKSGRNTTVSLSGVVTERHLGQIRDLFGSLVSGDDVISIELSRATYIDPAFCGLVLLMYKHAGDRLRLMNESSLVRRILSYNGIDFLLERG